MSLDFLTIGEPWVANTIRSYPTAGAGREYDSLLPDCRRRSRIRFAPTWLPAQVANTIRSYL